MDNMLLIVAGGLTGLLVGLTGVGGGALMTPLLLLVFGVAPAAAIGTDLWFAACTKLVATRVYHNHDVIDWQIVKRLWLGSLPASALTLLWMYWQSAQIATYGNVLSIAVAIAVMLTAIALLFQKHLQTLGQKYRTTEATRFKAVQKPLTVIAGVLLGLLVTLTSVGAGALGVVMLTYLYPFRLTPPRLVASDVVHAIPLTMFAGFGHLLIGNIDFTLLGNLLLGSIPCVVIGALLSNRITHGLLRAVLALVLIRANRHSDFL